MTLLEFLEELREPKALEKLGKTVSSVGNSIYPLAEATARVTLKVQEHMPSIIQGIQVAIFGLLLFVEIYETDRDEVEAFLEANWVISPSTPDDLRQKVVDLHKSRKGRYTSNIIIGHYHKNNHAALNIMLESWKSHPILSQRIHIFRAALNAHIRKEYMLSIPTLLPQIEGVLSEYIARYKLPTKLGKPTTIYQDVLKEPEGYRWIVGKIAKTLLEQLKSSVYPWTEFSQEITKPISKRATTRHTVSHGILVNYTASDSLRFFLLLDALSTIHDELERLHEPEPIS